MAEKIDVSLPEGVVIGDGWQIVFAAVDPTTGADVSGVVITNANIVAEDVVGGSVLPPEQQGPVGPFMLVPGPGV